MLDEAAITDIEKDISEKPDKVSRRHHTQKKPADTTIYLEHWRYVSDDNNIIVINRAENPEDKPKLTRIDLSQRYLPSPDEMGTSKALPALRPLTDYPHLCNSIRALARKLTYEYGTTSANTSVMVIKSIYNAIRFMHFIVPRGKYFLSDVTRTDIHAFLKVVPGGWYTILNMKKKWKAFTSLIKKDDKTAHNATTVIGDKLMISVDNVTPIFGFDVAIKHIPRSTYINVARIVGVSDISKVRAQGTSKLKGFDDSNSPKQSPAAIEAILRSVNHLREIPDGYDRLEFFPFHSPNELAKDIAHKPKGRTENISLEDAVKLLDTSLKWIYDYSPIVLSMMVKLREQIKPLIDRDDLATGYKREILNEWFRGEWKEHCKHTPLPDLDVNTLNINKSVNTVSFLDLITTIHTSCAVVIGINNARRRNEIIGEGGWYGLYYGCVSNVNDGALNHKKIDIYIEKTVQEYCTFWTNDLTADAVSLLEEFYRLFLPVTDNVTFTPPTDIDLARKLKLFQIKNINPDGFANEWRPFKFDEHSHLFFKLADVGNKKLHKRTHPFRRLFSLIYHYRFKDQKLHALSQHLRHTDMEMTRVYITDPMLRLDAERIEKLYKEARFENEKMDSVYREVQHELALELVGDVLDGKAAGGFSKRVKRLHKLLLVRTKPVKGRKRYKSLPRGEQTEILTDSIEKHGHKPNSRAHGVCWANDEFKGACRDERTKKLERENAVPTLCVSCPYHNFSEEYISNLYDDLDYLGSISMDYDLSLAQRNGARAAADNLKSLIELERKLVSEEASI